MAHKNNYKGKSRTEPEPIISESDPESLDSTDPKTEQEDIQEEAQLLQKIKEEIQATQEEDETDASLDAGITVKRRKRPAVSFTDEQEEMIIELVKNVECLYNKKHRHYKNKEKKDRLWQEIAEQLQLPIDEMKRWFSSQRTVYSKITSTKAPLELSDRQKWVHEKLQFLDRHIARMPTRNRSLPSASQNEPAATVSEEMFEGIPTVATFEQTPAASRRKRKLSDDNEQLERLIKRDETTGLAERIQELIKAYDKTQEPRDQFTQWITSEFKNIHYDLWVDFQMEVFQVTHKYIKKSKEMQERERKQHQAAVVDTPILIKQEDDEIDST